MWHWHSYYPEVRSTDPPLDLGQTWGPGRSYTKWPLRLHHKRPTSSFKGAKFWSSPMLFGFLFSCYVWIKINFLNRLTDVDDTATIWRPQNPLHSCAQGRHCSSQSSWGQPISLGDKTCLPSSNWTRLYRLQWGGKIGNVFKYPQYGVLFGSFKHMRKNYPIDLERYPRRVGACKPIHTVHTTHTRSLIPRLKTNK